VLLQAAADETRRAVLSRFNPDSCIATTRVLIDVLSYLGVRAQAWAVNLTLFNPEAWELYRMGIPAREWPPAAWSVGMRGDRAGEVGHIVAVAGPRLIDASIDQAARPGKGLPVISPLVAGLAPGTDLTRRDRLLVYEVGTTRLTYGASGSTGYVSSRNWRRGEPDTSACIDDVLRALHAGKKSNGCSEIIPDQGGL
jgi:hypothetical protein